MKRRTTRGRLGGGRWPKWGKVKGWYKKGRLGRKGRKLRYGGGPEVSKKRRGAEGRNQRTKQRARRKETGKRYRKGLVGGGVKMGGYGAKGAQERRRQERWRPVDNLRGDRERRADRRRWRGGRVDTRRGGRERRKRGEVRRVVGNSSEASRREGRASVVRETKKATLSYADSYAKQARRAKEKSRSNVQVEVGGRRKVKEERWKRRKGERREKQYGGEVVGRNGRTQRAYRRVDYRVGVRRVRRKPRSGEVRRPLRMERSRMMRRK
jgi:hypothetical protein